jgi:lipid-A-disaccharide synthase
MRVLMVTGEPSGDAHAAPVARRLLAAGAAVEAVGGPALASTGAQLLSGIDSLSVLGFVDVLGLLPRLAALKADLDRRLRRGDIDLLLTVDYPGFNLRLAGSAHAAGIPVLHYIGPQVWAWRSGRLATLRRVATHVALILPFEKPIYDRAGIPATHVGHPLVDDPPPEGIVPEHDLGLFPGSRAQELVRHLPVLLEAAAQLRAARPGLRIVVSRAPGVAADAIAPALAHWGFDPERDLVAEPARILMRRCRAMLVASGTATLEAALAARPFAVLYRTNRINYAVARRLVHVPHVALANLVAGEGVVREYLQDAATPAALAAEATRLLDDDTERRRIVAGLERVRERLGPPGASARVAQLATEIAAGAVRSP